MYGIMHLIIRMVWYEVFLLVWYGVFLLLYYRFTYKVEFGEITETVKAHSVKKAKEEACKQILCRLNQDPFYPPSQRSLLDGPIRRLLYKYM